MYVISSITLTDEIYIARIKGTRINSAGALLAGRGQYSTVKNGTRHAVLISCRADGRDTVRTRTRTRGDVQGQRDRGRAEVG